MELCFSLSTSDPKSFVCWGFLLCPCLGHPSWASSFHACCWLCSFLACCWLCSFLACCWLCSFLACCWLCSWHSFARASSLLLGYALLFFCTCTSLLLGNALFTRCGSALLASFLRHHPIWPCLPTNSLGFSWSCVRSTASLLRQAARPFHVLSSAAPPHALPRAARGLVSQFHTYLHIPSSARCACRGCISRGRLLWVVNAELSRLSALLAPLCGSLQRRTRGLLVWHLRHHCVVVISR